MIFRSILQKHFHCYQCIHRLFTTKPSLSFEQATTALRPFFFAVHPDFFTKCPREKIVNENSLKSLNGYLDSINQGQSTQPVQVGFYLRNSEGKTIDHSNLRFVTIRLQDLQFGSLVQYILSSCDLSLDHLNSISNTKPKRSINTSQSQFSHQDIEWEEFLERFSPHRFRNSSNSFSDASSPDRVSPGDAITWLKVNSERAHELHLQNLPVQREIQSITSELCGAFNLSDIVWTSDWNAISRRGCLASLHRMLLSSNKDKKFLESILDSHRILISSRGGSGLSIMEDIVLNSVEVPASWYRSLNTISTSSRHVLDKKVPAQERLLSILLGGAEVSRLPELHQSLLAEVYFTLLLFVNKRLAASVQRQGGAYPGHQYVQDKKFQQLLVALDDIGDIPTVSSQGHFLIPARCPAFLIYDYIHHAASIASKNSLNYERISNELLQLKSRCIYHLNLCDIHIESNISPSQAIYCLQSLIDELNHTAIPDELTGLGIKISHFYSVTSEGVLTLPWNWRNLQ